MCSRQQQHLRTATPIIHKLVRFAACENVRVIITSSDYISPLDTDGDDDIGKTKELKTARSSDASADACV